MNQEELNEIVVLADLACRRGKRRTTCPACGGRGRTVEMGPCARCNGLGDVPPTPGSHTVLLLLEEDPALTQNLDADAGGFYPIDAGGPMGRIVDFINRDGVHMLHLRFDAADLLRWALDQGAKLPERP